MGSFSLVTKLIPFLLIHIGIVRVWSQTCTGVQYVGNDDVYAVIDDCTGYTQEMAQIFCDTEFGTDLATLNSRDTNRDAFNLRSTLPDGSSYNAWIGASDAGSEGTWRWPNGALVTYTAWFRGEPNNYGDGQHCAIMGQGSNRWDDQACMCEM